MSRSDRLLVSLARAFIYNPEVLVVRGLEGSAEGSLHVGDSFENDVLGARSVGIEPVLLDRSRPGTRRDVRSARCLTELQL